jgi:hypothetical protein
MPDFGPLTPRAATLRDLTVNALFAAVLCESIKRIFEERICQVHVSQVAFNGLPERRVYPIFISALWV